ncbi:MAG: hypothetical protein NT085_05685 [candidate division SR1 bacterium]|nr:hypothetical protein [candidate division SR1 bacterium]
MTNQDQQKWLKGFSRVGFLLPWIYLLRARQYVFAILAFIIPYGAGYVNGLLAFILGIAISIIIGIKGRSLALAKTKKSFEDFKNGYKKASKIIIIVFVVLFGIILIGIFSAAIIPRLSGTRGRANDVARKADLQRVAAALVSYQIDHGSFPQRGGSLDTTLKDTFKEAYSGVFENPGDIPEPPKDPNQNTSFNGLINVAGTPGQYMYIPLNKSGNTYEGFALIAKTETERGSNRVFDKNLPIEAMTDVNSIKTCDSLIISSYIKNINDGKCYYTNTGDLGYVFTYKTTSE